jgi:hypothetical protein
MERVQRSVAVRRGYAESVSRIRALLILQAHFLFPHAALPHRSGHERQRSCLLRGPVGGSASPTAVDGTDGAPSLTVSVPMLTPLQLLVIVMVLPVLIASFFAWMQPQDRHPNPSS